MIKSAAVAGAGTMGSGIALSIAMANLPVTVFDLRQNVVDAASKNINHILIRMVEKEKISAEQQTEIFNRIQFTTDINKCVADIVVEAIIEKIEAKVDLFKQLAAINAPTTILASNTSSLRINEIQKHVPGPERVAGLHYFNPAHLMKLVEVVRGDQTNNEVIDQLVQFCKQQKKSPVVCKDSPGFIVNRVARHFYLESMKCVEEEMADLKTVDAVMESAGFKMGPFRLMDMIGMDINLAVSESLYNAYNQHPRFKPSALQQQKVKEGKLGRKTGEGFFKYPTSA